MIMLGDTQLIRVFAKHDPYWGTGHLGEVQDQMLDLGPPTINVVEWRGDFYAVEGSHRLCAAYNLGLIPKLVVNQPEHFDPSDEQFLEFAKLRLPHYTWEMKS
jgi:hypothetical protein